MGVKEKLIHLLGGITEQEAKESNYNSAQIGRYEALLQVRAYMREINGEDADAWCNLACKIEEMTF